MYVVEVFDCAGLFSRREAKDWTHCVQIYRGTAPCYGCILYLRTNAARNVSR